MLDFPSAEIERLLGRIQERMPLCRVILVNADRGDNIFFLLNWPVVKGVIYQQDNDTLISKAIDVVCKGRSWFPRNYMDYLVRHRKTPTRCGHVFESLTSRERQMLDHVVRGMSNNEIADALCLSTHTVKAHLQSLYRKVGVKNRVGVMRVHENHLEEEGVGCPATCLVRIATGDVADPFCCPGMDLEQDMGWWWTDRYPSANVSISIAYQRHYLYPIRRSVSILTTFRQKRIITIKGADLR